MNARVLFTGFKPPVFLPINPSELLMESIAESRERFPGEIKTCVLDVDYVNCEEQLREAIASFNPDAILSFGVDCDRDWIAVELLALNLDACDDPDNAGRRRVGEKIVEDGPVGYWATLPAKETAAALRAAGIRAGISGYAGAHLCNHLLYCGLHHATQNRLSYLMGFLHIPPLPEQIVHAGTAKHGMPLKMLLEAAAVCANVVNTQIARGSESQRP